MGIREQRVTTATAVVTRSRRGGGSHVSKARHGAPGCCEPQEKAGSFGGLRTGSSPAPRTIRPCEAWLRMTVSFIEDQIDACSRVLLESKPRQRDIKGLSRLQIQLTAIRLRRRICQKLP